MFSGKGQNGERAVISLRSWLVEIWDPSPKISNLGSSKTDFGVGTLTLLRGLRKGGISLIRNQNVEQIQFGHF